MAKPKILVDIDNLNQAKSAQDATINELDSDLNELSDQINLIDDKIDTGNTLVSAAITG